MKQYYILLLTLVTFSFSNAQIVNIPDANFKNALISTPCADLDGDMMPDGDVDANDDGEIQVSEAEAVINLFVSSANIVSVSGIESFINLQKLYCNDNQLTTLDVSNSLSLSELWCAENQLSSIDVSQNLNLFVLIGNDNQLTNLDVTQNTNLYSLYCHNNQLTSLDLSLNSNLNLLKCNNNQLNDLDVSNSISITRLNCAENQISTLNLGLNSVMNYLTCSNNQITSLNVSSMGALIGLECNNNLLTNIDVSNNVSLKGLNSEDNQFSTLTLTSNTLLTRLFCSGNSLISLDLSQNGALEVLKCSNNQLTSLDFNQTPLLKKMECNDNQITSLDLSPAGSLKVLECNNNILSSLDMSNNKVLSLLCEGNNLTTLQLKDGFFLDFSDFAYTSPPEIDEETIFVQEMFYTYHLLSHSASSFNNNLNLAYICTNDYEEEVIQTEVDGYGYSNCVVNSYCSFVPGGTFFSVNGQTNIDSNLDGCDVSDPIYPNLKFDITNGVVSGSLIVDTTGNYSVSVQGGVHTITPEIEVPTYYTVSPVNIVVDFPTDTSPYQQDFCITPNGTFNDLEIVLIPLENAKPGFDSDYKIVYKNKGTTTLSGTVGLDFNDDLMGFVSASPVADVQTTGSLTWNYTNLQPFETRMIEFTMIINTPTDPTFPVLGDDVLDYTATINPVAGDETPEDNVFELHQTVVNAFDPNDKTCLEGKTIAPTEVGDYVHYMIRFENTGTASAINIVVKDVIDMAKYDISTLIPLHGSHSYVTRVRETNIVEFIFENINLPFDDANNDGYVAFKIKTQPSLVVNDTFENNAEIYFDYNAPIITNIAQTTVAILGLADFAIDNSLGMHPNPAQDVVFIKGKNNLKEITIFDINGRVLNSISVVGSQLEKELNITKLTQGIYFVRVVSSKGQFVSKLIKE